MYLLSVDQRVRLLEGLRENRSIRSLVAHVPCSPNTIMRWQRFFRLGLCGCGKSLHDGACSERPRVDGGLAAQIIAARVEENLTTAEIAERFNVSLAVAYTHLRGYPQKNRTRRPDAHTWTAAEDAVLARLYPTAPWVDVVAALPNRGRQAIYKRAADRDLHRHPFLRRSVVKETHPLIAKLADERCRRKMRSEDLATKAGINRQSIIGYELGNSDPTFDRVARWAAALGYEVVLAPLDGATARLADITLAPPVRPPERVAVTVTREEKVVVPTIPIRVKPRSLPPATLPPIPKRKPPPQVGATRAAELRAMEEFMAKKGATRVPGVGDPEIAELPPLRYDRHVRRETRRLESESPSPNPRGWARR